MTTSISLPYSTAEFDALSSEHSNLLVAYTLARREWLAADEALQALYARDPGSLTGNGSEPEHARFVAAKASFAQRQAALREFGELHPALVEELTGKQP